MLIGFDATPLEVKNRSGVSHYVAQLLAALVARHDGRRYALLASQSLNGYFPAGTLGQVGLKFPVRSLWMQLVLPAIVARLSPDICHFTNYIAPLVGSRPFVVTLYDMALFKHPHVQPRKTLLMVRSIVPMVARRAAAIITTSHSTRADVVSTLGVPPENVHVVYAAAGPEFRIIENEGELDRVRRKYGLFDAFVLCVSTIEPRKNLARLVQAFAELRRRGRQERLILVGQLGWKYAAIFEQIEQLGLLESVRLLGYVPEEDLPALYNLARAVAFPLLDEGFGLPIVEGMACGVPVLTSDRSSMAEVAGEAALLIDPTDVHAMADGLMQVLSDTDSRARLRAAGLARAAEFSWVRAAEQTVAVYDAVVGK